MIHINFQGYFIRSLFQKSKYIDSKNKFLKKAVLSQEMKQIYKYGSKNLKKFFKKNI